MEEISQKHLDEVCAVFTAFEGKEDMQELLLDVCTRKELESIYQRFKVAQMLKNGMTFVQIEARTGISSTTITRVSKCLKRGQGYNKVFDKYNLSIDIEE
jgi:TrpR-related protein YerC/YecD